MTCLRAKQDDRSLTLNILQQRNTMMIQGMQKLDRLEQMIKSVLQNRHWSGIRSGVLFRPRTIGLPIAADIAQTNSIVNHTLLLFLCFAYFIGWVTAMYLQFKFDSCALQFPHTRRALYCRKTVSAADLTTPLSRPSLRIRISCA